MSQLPAQLAALSLLQTTPLSTNSGIWLILGALVVLVGIVANAVVLVVIVCDDESGKRRCTFCSATW